MKTHNRKCKGFEVPHTTTWLCDLGGISYTWAPGPHLQNRDKTSSYARLL